MKKGKVAGLRKEERERDLEEKKASDYAMGNWRIGFFDIETTHLKGNFGHVLCACIKDAGGGTKVWSVD